MTTSLSGRNFLKLLDFTSEEILSLVDLAQELKEKNTLVFYIRSLKARTLYCCSRKLRHVPVAPLKLLAMILVWVSLT